MTSQGTIRIGQRFAKLAMQANSNNQYSMNSSPNYLGLLRVWWIKEFRGLSDFEWEVIGLFFLPRLGSVGR